MDCATLPACQQSGADRSGELAVRSACVMQVVSFATIPSVFLGRASPAPFQMCFFMNALLYNTSKEDGKPCKIRVNFIIIKKQKF